MEKKNTIFDFIGQIFIIYGFSIICLIIFVYLFGEDAKEYATIFELGSEGISLATLLQFLLNAVMINGFRQLFMGATIIKNMSLVLRTLCMFTSIIIMMILFVWLFGWFPVNDWLPWVSFAICFIISSLVGFLVWVLKEKTENKKMQEALERMQKGTEQ